MHKHSRLTVVFLAMLGSASVVVVLAAAIAIPIVGLGVALGVLR